MHSYNYLWISVCDFQNESKLNHVFLLVWIAALLHNHSQSSRANRSVWNLALIWHRLTFPMENSPNRCLAKRASSRGPSDVEEVRVRSKSHMNARSEKLLLTMDSILGSACCLEDWSGIVSFVNAWPSEVRSCAVNLSQEKSRRPETRRKAWESSSERRTLEKHSFVITHLWSKRPDILSAVSKACWLLPLITSPAYYKCLLLRWLHFLMQKVWLTLNFAVGLQISQTTEINHVPSKGTKT